MLTWYLILGEYVSLYQVQRGLLRQRAEQLATERQKLSERITMLTNLLPRLAPQLKSLPQWSQLKASSQETGHAADCCAGEPTEEPEHIPQPNESKAHIETEVEVEKPPEPSLDHVASNIVRVLMEIASSNLTAPNESSQPELLHLEASTHAPHESFHPCPVCSGRLMTV